MIEIEYVNGNESHSSNWQKFYVEGLEKFAVKEDFDANQQDNHHNYQGYVCLDIPTGTVFSVFSQSGNKRGTEDFCFYICVAEEKAMQDISNLPAFIKGNFRVVAEGITLTKAPRLMDWWINSGRTQSLEFAELCAKYIDKRGLKILPES